MEDELGNAKVKGRYSAYSVNPPSKSPPQNQGPRSDSDAGRPQPLAHAKLTLWVRSAVLDQGPMPELTETEVRMVLALLDGVLKDRESMGGYSLRFPHEDSD